MFIHLPFSVVACDYASVRSECLRKHKLVHTGEKNFQCSQCGKRFNNKEALTNHVALHSNAKPFVCDWPECEKSYPTRAGLRQHIYIIHEKRKVKHSMEN